MYEGAAAEAEVEPEGAEEEADEVEEVELVRNERGTIEGFASVAQSLR